MIGLLVEPAPWMRWAACRGMDPAMFYPPRGENPRAALTVCWGCPVRTECLAYAVAHGERIGIWGGTTERQRRRARGWRVSTGGGKS